MEDQELQNIADENAVDKSGTDDTNKENNNVNNENSESNPITNAEDTEKDVDLPKEDDVSEEDKKEVVIFSVTNSGARRATFFSRLASGLTGSGLIDGISPMQEIQLGEIALKALEEAYK